MKHEGLLVTCVGTIGTAVTEYFNSIAGACTGLVTLAYVTMKLMHEIKEWKKEK
jgi:hypothetical protein